MPAPSQCESIRRKKIGNMKIFRQTEIGNQNETICYIVISYYSESVFISLSFVILLTKQKND